MPRWSALVIFVVAMSYVVYRVGLSVALVRASKAGDTERADQLREKSFKIRVLVLGISALGSVVLVVLLVATR